MKTKTIHIKKSLYLAACLLLGLGWLSTNQLHAQENSSEPETQFTEFKGTVLDAQTKKPLVFATISLEGTNASTISNSQGDYLLKVPNTLLNKAVVVSFLGYESIRVLLDPDKAGDFDLALQETAIALNEVDVVVPKDAKTLVQETLAKKGENYFNSPTKMTAFYRETIKKRRKNVSLSEAVVNVYKSAYNSEKEDDISLYKARKSTDYSKLDTLALKLQGGPFNTLYVDVMKYPEYLFSEDYIDSYRFSYGSSTRIDDQLVYLVNFEPLESSSETLFKGTLYIDITHKILTSALFSMDLKDPKAAARLFVKRKPKNANVWPTEVSYRVDYREKEGKWYYGYSNLLLSFKIDWDDKLFNSVYSLQCEMAITDWKNSQRSELPKRKDLIKKSIILTDEAIGFSDPDFWGDYNIIEPEKSIENAIRKIRRQLSKANDNKVVKP
ncbi:carboxypeptidase-like regulatory domain-containing protein [Flavobacteriaceae bacterium LSUCC0859]|nr:carboxypeptidase-like regulatory domain-containing protein [Flavobacteriaceae bacterium LSUCC0859]